MPLFLPITIALIALMTASSIFFAAKVIYPKVLSLEETRLSEIENDRYDETEYNQWHREEVTISSPFGYDLACAYFPLEGAQKTVILSHGITWSRYGSISTCPPSENAALISSSMIFATTVSAAGILPPLGSLKKLICKSSWTGLPTAG